MEMGDAPTRERDEGTDSISGPNAAQVALRQRERDGERRGIEFDERLIGLGKHPHRVYLGTEKKEQYSPLLSWRMLSGPVRSLGGGGLEVQPDEIAGAPRVMSTTTDRVRGKYLQYTGKPESSPTHHRVPEVIDDGNT
ncbi:unnamed protein product [Pleuronectes platessa]|uniref:Uncharacterized protein n=1 Tax=Pleuronectes platessa TaxID=8262 RepID=A0A9N7YG70_PLEPL|nr:unnamed protein product [Pleuronectes platessa]